MRLQWRMTQQVIQNSQIILIRIKIQNNQAQTNYNWSISPSLIYRGSHSNNLFPWKFFIKRRIRVVRGYKKVKSYKKTKIIYIHR